MLKCLASCALALAGTALAQAPVQMPSIPSASCAKPEYPGRLASDQRRAAFNKEYKAYGDCVKQYVESIRKLSEQAQTAGNAAVEDYNAYSKELQAQLDGKSE